MGALPLDMLLDRARVASAKVMTERDDARSSAVAAIRALEQRLQEAVAGDVLRGLRDLGKPYGTFHAAAVGRNLSHGIDTRVSWGKRGLYVTKDAELWTAVLEDGQLRARAVLDDELRAEDLEHVIDAARAALAQHVASCDRTAASYGRAAALAARLARAIGG
jgi:hypothetical protein